MAPAAVSRTAFEWAPSASGRTKAKCADADTSQCSASPTTTSTISAASGSTIAVTCRTCAVTVIGASSGGAGVRSPCPAAGPARREHPTGRIQAKPVIGPSP